jgi:PAS domain S-box-containing protein
MRRPWRYLLAVAAVAVAAAFQLGFPALFAGPFILYYPAVALSAAVGGLGPGLLATGLVLPLASYLVLEPVGSFVVDEVRDIVSLGVFAFMGVVFSVFAARFRKVRKAAQFKSTELQTLLDAVPAAVFVARDRAAQKIEANRFGADLMKVPLDANVSKSAPGEAGPRTFKAMKGGIELSEKHLPVQVAAAQGVEVRNFEFDLVTGDGVAKHLIGNAVPLRDPSGTIAGAVGTFVDVTTIRAAEARAREREEQLRSTFAAMTEGVVLQAAGGKIVQCNAAAERILGLSRSQMEGRTSVDPQWRSIHEDGSPFPGEDHPAMVALRTGEPVSDVIMGVHKPDGALTWISINAEPIRADSGVSPYAVVTTFADVTARKQATEALRESELGEARLKGLEERVNEIEFVVRLDGSIVHANDRTLQAYGYSRAEILGLNVRDLRAESARALVGEQMARAASEGARFETVHRRKDGTTFSVSVSSRRFNVGGDAYLHSLVVDLTERQAIERERLHAEEALRVRESKLRAYFNTRAVGIAVSKPEKLWVDVNDTFCAMLGYSREELQKLTWTELTHPDDVEADVREFNRVLAGETEGYSLDKRYIRKDGSILWVLLAVSCVRFPDRSVEFFVAVARDITDRKRAEAAGAASEAKYRGLFDSLMDGFVKVDMDGVIQESNEVYRKMLGYSAEELAQTTYMDITPERWHPMEARIIEEQVLPLGYSQVYEKEYRRKDGTVFPVELRTLLLKEGGRPVALWAIIRDVTDTRALQAQVALTSRLAALGTLVAGVAHEINNPLAAALSDQDLALGAVRKLRERLRGSGALDREAEVHHLDEVVEELGEAQEAGRRIERIVKDLKVFGRPNQKDARQRVRLIDVVDLAMRWLPAAISQTATVAVENGGAPDVVATAGQITQVVVNLVTNAAKATVEGTRGAIVIRVGPGKPGMARLEVIDLASGIEPAVLSHIFEPFFTTSDVGKGTGLGLSICHSIVTAHGGTLTVQSEVGKGSTFRVELPVAPVEA